VSINSYGGMTAMADIICFGAIICEHLWCPGLYTRI